MAEQMYIVYCWRWPDADDVDADIFPIQMIGVGKNLFHGFDLAYDDIRVTMDDVEMSNAEFIAKFKNIRVTPKTRANGIVAYDFEVQDFRYTWTVEPCMLIAGF